MGCPVCDEVGGPLPVCARCGLRSPPRFRRRMPGWLYWSIVAALMAGAVLVAWTVMLWIYRGGLL